MSPLWQKYCDGGHFCHSSGRGTASTLLSMLLITCPVTGTDVLLSAWDIRSLVNHPTHIELTVACPCGATHVHRTGRRWAGTDASIEAPTARRADELVPA
jgi:hypothetical protein